MEKINARAAAQLLGKVALGKEDYVYVNPNGTKAVLKLTSFYGEVIPVSGIPCEYSDFTERPSCIVGHALARAGRDITGLYGSASVLWEEHRLALTEGASKVFQIAQAVQDNGGTWGAAFLAAWALINEGIVDGDS